MATKKADSPAEHTAVVVAADSIPANQGLLDKEASLLAKLAKIEAWDGDSNHDKDSAITRCKAQLAEVRKALMEAKK